MVQNGSAVNGDVSGGGEPITVQHKMVPVQRTPKNFTGRVRELMDWRVATFAQNAHNAAFVAVRLGVMLITCQCHQPQKIYLGGTRDYVTTIPGMDNTSNTEAEVQNWKKKF